MELNADFAKRAVVHAAQQDWIASPMAGVDRRMLDRIGDEVARATTIVRYAPGSSFSPHTHTGGEEFFVLDGVFQDEHGDFPAGSYIRNPPESMHTPGSAPGTTIFVKLWQFDLADRTHVRVDTNKRSFAEVAPGVGQMELHRDMHEQVVLEHWAPGTEVTLDGAEATEVLVLEGGFTEAGEHFVQQSWLRLPSGHATTAKAGAEGAKVWIKRGGLPPKAPA